jgi:hypothetical protein
MKLAAERVKELQYFLMAAAHGDVASQRSGGPSVEALLASAAALDYVLLLCSERPDELVDPGSTALVSVREAMLRAMHLALGVVAATLETPNDTFAQFAERHVRAGRIFETLYAISKSDVVVADDVAFEIITSASDLFDRLGSGDSPRRGTP